MPNAHGPGLRMRVASNDIAVGPNRFLLSLHQADDGALGEATVLLRFFHVDGPEPDEVKAKTDTLYLGANTSAARELYSSRVTFTATGGWRVVATVSRRGQEPMEATTQFRVKARSDMPAIGHMAIASANSTLDDTPIERLTSQRPVDDLDFYRKSIADALAEPKPLMIVFSTPAFCQTRRCGPQLDAAQTLKVIYGDRMNFVHIEIFERPDLLLAGQREGTPKIRNAVREWRLQVEPIVYVVDAHGIIADRFEGFAPREELEPAIQAVLAPTPSEPPL